MVGRSIRRRASGTHSDRQIGLGRVHKHYDEAGLLTFERYDFKRNAIEKSRRVVRDPAILSSADFHTDWQSSAGNTLEAHAGTLLDATEYQKSTQYDALARVKRAAWSDRGRPRRGRRHGICQR